MANVGPIQVDKSTVVVHLMETNGEITSMRSKHSELMVNLLSQYEKNKKVEPGTFRYLIDGDRMPTKSNTKTVGDYAFEQEVDGVLQLTCFSEQVGGSRSFEGTNPGTSYMSPDSVTRHVLKYISK